MPQIEIVNKSTRLHHVFNLSLEPGEKGRPQAQKIEEDEDGDRTIRMVDLSEKQIRKLRKAPAVVAGELEILGDEAAPAPSADAPKKRGPGRPRKEIVSKGIAALSEGAALELARGATTIEELEFHTKEETSGPNRPAVLQALTARGDSILSGT